MEKYTLGLFAFINQHFYDGVMYIIAFGGVCVFVLVAIDVSRRKPRPTRSHISNGELVSFLTEVHSTKWKYFIPADGAPENVNEAVFEYAKDEGFVEVRPGGAWSSTDTLHLTKAGYEAIGETQPATRTELVISRAKRFLRRKTPVPPLR